MKILALLFALATSLAVADPPPPEQKVLWETSYAQVRSGVSGVEPNKVVWAYWFGVGETKTYMQMRVLLPELLAAEDITAGIAFSRGLLPNVDFFVRPASPALWDTPRVQAAVAEATAEFRKELIAGTVPKPRQLRYIWVVAANPSATDTPPTRPMFDPVTLKQVSERAIVGLVCDRNYLPIPRGTQKLLPLFHRPPSPDDERPGVRATANVTACVPAGQK